MALFPDVSFAWPSSASNLFYVISFVNFSIELTGPECSVGSGFTFVSKWWFGVLTPVLVFLVYLVDYGVFVVWQLACVNKCCADRGWGGQDPDKEGGLHGVDQGSFAVAAVAVAVACSFVLGGDERGGGNVGCPSHVCICAWDWKDVIGGGRGSCDVIDCGTVVGWRWLCDQSWLRHCPLYPCTHTHTHTHTHTRGDRRGVRRRRPRGWRGGGGLLRLHLLCPGLLARLSAGYLCASRWGRPQGDLPRNPPGMFYYFRDFCVPG